MVKQSEYEGIKVVTRVRPFNNREKMEGAENAVTMTEATTSLINPSTGEAKTFTFDKCYWSNSDVQPGGGPDEGANSDEGDNDETKLLYASQEQVTNDIATELVDNAIDGYNTTFITYGACGSGKAHTMIGYRGEQGVIPRTLSTLFARLAEEQARDQENQDGNNDSTAGGDTVSEAQPPLIAIGAYEIYLDRVYDLTHRKSNRTADMVQKQRALKVREHPDLGVYIEDLDHVLVDNIKDAQSMLTHYLYQRHVASTPMNATAARSHVVVEVLVILHEGTENETASSITFVALAGQETVHGLSGTRLKETTSLNAGLYALGKVMSVLAEKSQTGRNLHVPYRSHILTRVLQKAIGGNSRTILAAHLSPADTEYTETLTTMRYAHRVTNIYQEVTTTRTPSPRKSTGGAAAAAAAAAGRPVFDTPQTQSPQTPSKARHRAHLQQYDERQEKWASPSPARPVTATYTNEISGFGSPTRTVTATMSTPNIIASPVAVSAYPSSPDIGVAAVSVHSRYPSQHYHHHHHHAGHHQHQHHHHSGHSRRHHQHHHHHPHHHHHQHHPQHQQYAQPGSFAPAPVQSVYSAGYVGHGALGGYYPY